MRPFIQLIFLVTISCIALVLSSCGSSKYSKRYDSAPRSIPNIRNIPDAIPHVEPLSKQGNSSSYVVFGKRHYVMKSSLGYIDRGIASWYGTKFHGHHTSNGERYDMFAMTAAHKNLPLPTYLQVTNLRNGRQVIVRVNDRGPFHGNRLIDLSYAAAYKLGILGKGTGLVEIRAINPRKPAPVKIARTAPPPKPNENIGMYLQVGAFSSRFNAEKVRQRLQKADITNIVISEAATEKNTVHRVRIGPIKTVEKVDNLALVLAALGIKNPHVIVE